MAEIKKRTRVVGGVLGTLEVADVNRVRDIIEYLLENNLIDEEHDVDVLERLDTHLNSVIEQATTVGKLF